MAAKWRWIFTAALCTGALVTAGCGKGDDGGEPEEDTGGGTDTDTGGGGEDTDGGGPGEDTDAGGETGGRCAEGEIECSRNRECEGAPGLSNPVCEDGCCVDSVLPCATHGDPCIDASQTNDNFICDTEAGICLARCNASQADTQESADCPRESWCFETSEPAPTANPLFNGVCIDGECDSIFDPTSCGGEGTCLAVGNGASFCISAGTAGEGDECGVEPMACTSDTDCEVGTCDTANGYCVECSSDADCGGDVCNSGVCAPATTICEPGLLCFSGACITPCNLENGDGDCGDLGCVAAFDTTRENRPGVCGTECSEFSLGECPEGDVCGPVTGRFRVNSWMCSEGPTDGAGPGEACTSEDGCTEGYLCLNMGSDSAPDLRCTQLCEPGGEGDAALSNCLRMLPGEDIVGATAFGEISDWVALAEGDYEAIAALDEDGSSLADLSIEIAEGDATTWIASLDPDGDLSIDAFLDLTDGDTNPSTGIRAIHVSQDAGDIDLYGGPRVVNGLEFGFVAEHVTALEGTYNLSLHDNADDGFVASLDGLTLADGSDTTVIVAGSVSGGSFALHAYDVDLSAPILPADAEAGIRFAHEAAGQGPVDVYIGCGGSTLCTEEFLLAADVEYGDTAAMLQYAGVDAGTISFFVFAAGADPATTNAPDVLVNGTAAVLSAGDRYTAVWDFQGGVREFGGFLTPSGASGDGHGDLTVIHTYNGGPLVDGYLESATPIAAALGYGDSTESDTGAFVPFGFGPHRFSGRTAGAGSGVEPAFAVLVNIEEDALNTLVAVGSLAAETFEILSWSEASPALEAGEGAIRFLHAVPGVGAVRIAGPGTPEDACFPGSVEGFGFCIESCAPYPRRGDGNYEECSMDGAQCRPFVPTSEELVDPQGICISFTGEFSPWSPCNNDGYFECEDFGLCFDVDFDEDEDPTCKPLCEPLSRGQCEEGTYCSPLLPLFGSLDIGLCDNAPVPGDVGDACEGGDGIPMCEADGTLCLDTGSGGQCTEVCRAGHPEDCTEGTCRTGVFQDPIPSFMGVCL